MLHLVFLTFSDNLFAVNPPPSFSSSSFTERKVFWYCDVSKKDLCRQQTLIESKIFVAFRRSLTYIRNNKGPCS